MPAVPGGEPAASVVVLNWNGGDLVLKCLDSVARQDFEPFEAVVVDNASTDGSREAIHARFPEARLVALDRNLGYAGGMNAGIEAARGEIMLLLNLDVELEPGYLKACVEALRADPQTGGVTGKLLKPRASQPPVIDSTGHVVYRNRRAVDRGEWEEDRGQYEEDRDLFSLCGAAPCYRRAMLDDLRVDGECYDEDFFAYFEDFDLCWRGQLRGWRFAFVPEAVARHHRGGSGGRRSTFVLACNHRNRILTMIHNDDPRSFLRHLPGIAYTEVRATLHMLWLRPAALLLAWAQLFRLVPRALRKRREIQRRRTTGRHDLEPWFRPYPYRGVVRRMRERAAAR